MAALCNEMWRVGKQKNIFCQLMLKSHGSKDPQGRATKHSVHVLALAINSDGRYLVSGGLDRHVHLWDVRTRQHVQAFHGHKGSVSCLAFKQGTCERLVHFIDWSRYGMQKIELA